MDFKNLSEFSPSMGFYNLKDKLINHVAERSFKAFDRADEIRNSIKTEADFAKYKENAKKTLCDFIGDIPYDKNLPLDAKITGVIEEDDLIIEKIIFTSRKNIYVTANLYIPKDGKDKHPAILMQMGHSLTGKTANTYQMGARIHAKAGFSVFCFDPIGQGERASYIENGKPKITPAVMEHQHTGHQCYLAGNNFVKYFLCDAMRAIDYLETRDDLDLSMLGAIGNSGGGTMTSVLMAYDDRIKIAAPSCFLTTRRAYYYAGGAQDSEQIWVGGTKNNFDHYELVSLFCPKPLLICTVDSDFFPLEGTDALFEKEKEFYRLMGKENNLRMTTDECTHSYTVKNAKTSAEFFKEQVFGEITDIDIRDIKIIPEEELWCTKTGYIITDAPDALGVFDENLKDYLSDSVKTKEEKKAFLLPKVFNNRESIKFYLKKIRAEELEDMAVSFYVWYSQPHLPNWGMTFSRKDKRDERLPVKILLFENGTDDLLKYKEEVLKSVNDGYLTFVVDLSSMGKCEPNTLYTAHDPKDFYGVLERLNKDLFFLDDSLCGIKAYDLLRCIELVKEEFGVQDITVEGFEKATVLVRIAEILSEDIKTVCKNEISLDDILTDRYYNPYNISGSVMPGLALYLK